MHVSTEINFLHYAYYVGSNNIGLASNTPGSRTRPVDEPESVDMLRMPSHDQLTTLVTACLALLITIVIALW